MNEDYPYETTNDPHELAHLAAWDEDVYRDLLDCENGVMKESEFDEKYRVKRAIMIIDMTGFTTSGLKLKGIGMFLRILSMHRALYPALKPHNPLVMHAFADNFTAIFNDPHDAIRASRDVHSRMEAYNRSSLARYGMTQCCVGIGYGDVYRIGRDSAMGPEMNSASKLGEDVAKGGETLLTESAYRAIGSFSGVRFKQQTHDEVPFHFYEAEFAD